jgi:hypothetical protein
MAGPFTVRAYVYRGMMQAPVRIPTQASTDSVFLLYQPYEGRMFATTNGITPVTMGPVPLNVPDQSWLLRIEVPDAGVIRYECVIPNAATPRVADANSPQIQGVQHIQWGLNWALSFIDAAGT